MNEITFRGNMLPVVSLRLIASLVVVLVIGCSESAQTDDTAQDAAPTSTGTLEFRANGEDFVRQGFVSRDGWQMDFEHLYVTLSELKAYQTDASFDPEADDAMVEDQPIKAIAASETVEVPQAITVDLAAGDEQAEPVLIETVSAPEGQYNALSWKMVPASSGPAVGSTLMMVGSAAKAGEVIPFTIRLDPQYAYTCGDYVGDTRKGILEAGGQAEVEATFHFDHVFGDGEAAPDDAINTKAVGFEPFAALAQDDALSIDMAELKQALSPEDYSTLEQALLGLGHVGEGHCSEGSTNHTSEGEG